MSHLIRRSTFLAAHLQNALDRPNHHRHCRSLLAFDASVKILHVPSAVKATAKLGIAPSLLFTLGVMEIICLIVYLIPRTAPIGAILWTGYLGGAIAVNLRVGNPLFTYVLFPTYIAALLWGGLYLRDARVRALIRPAA